MEGGERWRLAQAHEKEYWAHEAAGIAQGEISGPEWYKSRAEGFLQVLEIARRKYPELVLGSRVVEVGSGPVGLVPFLEAPDRYAVDPLSDYYGAQKEYASHRATGVRYLSARGESLAFEGGTVDTLICENALDHVEFPERVQAEFARVLKKGGLLFLRVEVFDALGAAIHGFLAATRLDPLHPHTFTVAGVAAMVTRSGFLPLHQEVGDFAKAREKSLASPSRRGRLLARVGMNPVIYTVLARKS